MKFRAEVTGSRESVWSSNAVTFKTADEAKAWLDALACRWTGFDAGRVVTDDTPRGELFDPADPRIHINMKK